MNLNDLSGKESYTNYHYPLENIRILLKLAYFSGNTKDFSRELNDRLKKVMESLRSASPSHSQSDTVAYPILQMGMFEVEQEHQLMKKLLSTEVVFFSNLLFSLEMSDN